MYRIWPCNNVMASLNLTHFTYNTIRVLLPVTRVYSQFTPLYDPLLNLWGTIRGFSESLKPWVTVNYVWFPIPPPYFYFLPKHLLQIMGIAPPYPKFATDNSFRKNWQSIRSQSTQLIFYLPKNLYHIVWRHNCPQYRMTQQGYFPVQVPNHWVSHKSTQGGLIIWSRVGMTSFPHNIIFITNCG